MPDIFFCKRWSLNNVLLKNCVVFDEKNIFKDILTRSIQKEILQKKWEIEDKRRRFFSGFIYFSAKPQYNSKKNVMNSYIRTYYVFFASVINFVTNNQFEVTQRAKKNLWEDLKNRNTNGHLKIQGNSTWNMKPQNWFFFPKKWNNERSKLQFLSWFHPITPCYPSPSMSWWAAEILFSKRLLLISICLGLASGHWSHLSLWSQPRRPQRRPPTPGTVRLLPERRGLSTQRHRRHPERPERRRLPRTLQRLLRLPVFRLRFPSQSLLVEKPTRAIGKTGKSPLKTDDLECFWQRFVTGWSRFRSKELRMCQIFQTSRLIKPRPHFEKIRRNFSQRSEHATSHLFFIRKPCLSQYCCTILLQ